MSEFLSVIEWFDETGRQMVGRIPPEGSGAIKIGSMVVVRDNQAAVFFRDGKGLDVLGPGRHVLTTANIPILTKMLSLPWGFTSPFRAEVVFVNQKLFTDMGWGTQQPVAYRDDEFGLVRLRAHGNYAVRVKEPLLFVNRLVGTMGVFRTEEIRDYLRDLIVSRLTDYFGENLRSLLDLPEQYDEMSAAMQERLTESFDRYGLELHDFFITAITPTDEVQKAIDKRSEMAAVGDLDAFLKYQAAQALGKAGEGGGGDASGAGGGGGSGVAGDAMALGAGAGIGMMLPGMVWEAFEGAGQAGPGATGAGGTERAHDGGAAIACPACHSPVSPDSAFCNHCGEPLVAGERCGECGRRLGADASFCPQCGTAVEAVPASCPNCRVELPEGAKFCPECGESIDGDGGGG